MYIRNGPAADEQALLFFKRQGKNFCNLGLAIFQRPGFRFENVLAALFFQKPHTHSTAHTPKMTADLPIRKTKLYSQLAVKVLGQQKAGCTVNMGNESPPKRGVLRAFCALLLLSACTPPQAGPLAAQPAPADPILQAVATASPFRPTSVSTPSGPVTLTVTSDYASAEGNECRAFTMATATASLAPQLACNQGNAWREIPPLAPADNASGLP